jgi:ribonucleoside-diphosphate reductase beta chain
MNEMMPLALGNTDDFYGPHGGHIPFGLTDDESMTYATDEGLRRFGTINSARGRPVSELDLDYGLAEIPLPVVDSTSWQP